MLNIASSKRSAVVLLAKLIRHASADGDSTFVGIATRKQYDSLRVVGVGDSLPSMASKKRAQERSLKGPLHFALPTAEWRSVYKPLQFLLVAIMVFRLLKYHRLL